MNNYFLDRHIEWMKTGEMPSTGLCNSIDADYKHLLALFTPLRTEWDEWRDREALGCWAFSGENGVRKYADFTTTEICYAYTPLRQTIVLFCHEILNSK